MEDINKHVRDGRFYAWRKRPTCQRKREDAHLKQEIRQIFEEHLGRYGAPRIHRELHDEGINCSRKRVARSFLPNNRDGLPRDNLLDSFCLIKKPLQSNVLPLGVQ
jgi:hypothetical protein